MEDFLELGADSAFAGCVSAALDVGGILKEREHTFFAVFGEGVQVKELIVGGSGIYFEVASVNDHANGRVDSERDAIDNAMRDADGINRERANTKALAGLDLNEIGV